MILFMHLKMLERIVVFAVARLKLIENLLNAHWNTQYSASKAIKTLTDWTISIKLLCFAFSNNVFFFFFFFLFRYYSG